LFSFPFANQSRVGESLFFLRNRRFCYATQCRYSLAGHVRLPETMVRVFGIFNFLHICAAFLLLVYIQMAVLLGLSLMLICQSKVASLTLFTVKQHLFVLKNNCNKLLSILQLDILSNIFLGESIFMNFSDSVVYVFIIIRVLWGCKGF
jgi:hypothetical protein